MHSVNHDQANEQVKPDDQGIWHGEDDKIWPVVVLRDDMIPDALRRERADDEVPVLSLQKNDM